MISSELYYDEDPAPKRLPAVEAEWPPEAFRKYCICGTELHAEAERTAGLCTRCRRQRAHPLNAEQLAELRGYYDDEGFLDASAEPLPPCYDLWPASLQFLFTWRRDEFNAAL